MKPGRVAEAVREAGRKIGRVAAARLVDDFGPGACVAGQQCPGPLQADTLGAANLPAVPLNAALEKQMLPSAAKVATALAELLAW